MRTRPSQPVTRHPQPVSGNQKPSHAYNTRALGSRFRKAGMAGRESDRRKSMTAVRSKLWSAGAVLAMTVLPLSAQDLASFEKKTTVKVLDNGLTIVIMERPEAPVLS